jgi:hypothetical protein
MGAKGGLGWAWFLNLGVPLMVLGVAYGCGGVAFLGGEAMRPASTALEGRKLASGLASRWDASAQLVRVEGWRVRRNGRLAEKPDSLWVYTFSRPGDGDFYEVRRDGRGTVDAGPASEFQGQALWEEPIESWRIDSPAVAEQALGAELPVGEEFHMQLTRDGVWRVGVEDGQFLHEIEVDARTGKRVL